MIKQGYIPRSNNGVAMLNNTMWRKTNCIIPKITFLE